MERDVREIAISGPDVFEDSYEVRVVRPSASTRGRSSEPHGRHAVAEDLQLDV
jgi:hypothetical protein